MKKIISFFMIFVMIFVMIFPNLALATEEEPQKEYLVSFRYENIKNKEQKKQSIKEKRNEIKKVITKEIKKELKVLKEYDYLSIIKVQMTESEANLIRKNPMIEFVEENIQLNASGSIFGNGTCSRITYNKDYKTQTKATALWNEGYTGKGVKVAVFDYGGYNHSDLNYAGAKSFVTGDSNWSDTLNSNDVMFGHGVHVDGIIASQTYGIAPEASLYHIKVLGDQVNANPLSYDFKTDYLIDAINWAILNDIDVVNMSFSFNAPIDLANLVKTKINEAYNSNNMIFVASAGNNGDGKNVNVENVTQPASYANVLAVSNALDETSLYQDSSTGSSVELAAPGFCVYSTYPRDYDVNDGEQDGYVAKSGTSMAAPMVTGVIALLKQKYSSQNLENGALLHILRAMAIPTSGYTPNGVTTDVNWEFGYGYLRAEVGNSIAKTLTLNDSNSGIYNLPSGIGNFSWSIFGTGYNVSKQNVNAVREYDNYKWIEIDTWLGKRWIQPLSYFEGSFKIILYENTTLYTDTSKTTTSGTITAPQTVTAYRRSGDMFEIDTWLGRRWIQPNNYVFGDFKGKLRVILNESTDLYYDKDGAKTGAVISPQTVNAIEHSGQWYKIKTSYGDRWIDPNSHTQIKSY